MGEDCKDCIYVKNLKERLDKLEKLAAEYEKRVTELERKSDVSGEQIKMIYKILNEIKDSIKDIGNKIDVLEQKPTRSYDAIKTAAIVAIISTVVGAVIGKLI